MIKIHLTAISHIYTQNFKEKMVVLGLRGIGIMALRLWFSFTSQPDIYDSFCFIDSNVPPHEQQTFAIILKKNKQ